MSNNIEGKVVVVTGASSGLGEAAARLLSEKGAVVVLGARRTDRIQALADEINGKGARPSPSRPTLPMPGRSKRSSMRRWRATAGSTSWSTTRGSCPTRPWSA